MEIAALKCTLGIKNVSAWNLRNDLLNPLPSQSPEVPFIAVLLKKPEPDNKTYDIESLDPPHDEKIYNLYHILRTTQENEDLDEEAAQKLEKTENILRQALRKRCNTLKSCINKCPKKKYTCTVTCKEAYDNYDICGKPKGCKKRNCRTDSPSWL
ncbi:unnamed protein product, partial [Brenthis ino]